MKKSFIYLIAIPLCCAGIFICHSYLMAGTSGKIAGYVTDANTGLPLSGANVLIEGSSLGAATDREGYYMILNVYPGFYTLRVTMMGYKELHIKDVRISIDLTTVVDAVLEPTVLEISDVVTVIAQRSFVQKDMTSSLSTVKSDEIEYLPVQNISDVLELQAGMIRDGNQFHIRGGRTGEVAYWIDGIPVTDVYDGAMGVMVENSAIEELQIISGTFNAEYGQAMSGIVNTITKEGGHEYKGKIKTYLGDYLSNADVYKVLKRTRTIMDTVKGKKDIIGEEENSLKKFNPIYNIEGSLSGPVPLLGNKLTFFANGRYISEEGYLYGRRWFTPQGTTGDSALVPLNQYQTISAQGKLAYQIKPDMKWTYNLLMNLTDRDHTYLYDRDYDPELFKYNPDGLPQQHSYTTTHILSWNHVLSAHTFYELKFTRFEREHKEYVYKHVNKGTDGYIHPDSLKVPTGYSYYRVGMDMNQMRRTTSYWITKLDLTSQISKVHQLKSGMELRVYELTLDRFAIKPKVNREGSEITPFEPSIPPVSDPYRDKYNRKPREFSAYLQDKMEYDDLIINAGLRFDYFDVNSVVPRDPGDPDIYNPILVKNKFKDAPDSLGNSIAVEEYNNMYTQYTIKERRSFMQRNVEAKMQLSPRLGIAYPISAEGVIHFSYGHFLQIPEFQYLYESGDFKLISGGLETTIGNADLKPQRTIMYEVGLQHRLSDNIGGDISLFYRDIRDWVGTSPVIQTEKSTTSYVKFENKDYSNVRGFTVKFEKRPSNHYAARLDYTYQVAEGSYSNPRDAFYAYQDQMEPRLALIPLGWDQRHTFNGILNVNINNWIITFKSIYRTGRPYTPSISKAAFVGISAMKDLPDNSERLPAIITLDLYLNKRFIMGSLEAEIFIYVYNVFDNRGEIRVFSDTGTAGYSTEIDPKDISYDLNRVGTLTDYLRHPSWYVAPRQIQVGMSVGF
jgi:outer membrane receptor protein involved in Fe transport